MTAGLLKSSKIKQKLYNFNNEIKYKCYKKLFEKIKSASKNIIIIVNFLNLKTI